MKRFILATFVFIIVFSVAVSAFAAVQSYELSEKKTDPKQALKELQEKYPQYVDGAETADPEPQDSFSLPLWAVVAIAVYILVSLTAFIVIAVKKKRERDFDTFDR